MNSKDNRVISELTKNGIGFDFERYAAEALAREKSECERYTALVIRELGVEFDINNNYSIRRAFTESLRYAIDSFSGEWLERHQYDNQAMYYLSWAKYHAGNLSRYSLEKLTSALGVDGRIHPEWYRCMNSTGRLVCRSPALQALPSNYRRYFLPAEGHTFVTVDYKAIDLRVLAALTKDPALIRNLSAGRDIHTETAAAIFNVPTNQVTHEQRQIGKRTNYAIAYGTSHIGLSKMLSLETGTEVSPDRAKEYIEKFLMQYPQVYGYRWDLLHNRTAPTSIGGRVFDVSGTKALNYPIQASTAEGLMNALAVIMDTKEDYMKLVLTIHDSITLEVPVKYYNATATYLQTTAEQVMGDYLRPVPALAELKNSI